MAEGILMSRLCFYSSVWFSLCATIQSKVSFEPSAQLQLIFTNTPKVGGDRILISRARFSLPELKLSFSPPNPNTRPPLLVGALLTFITRWLLRCNDAICNSGKYSRPRIWLLGNKHTIWYLLQWRMETLLSLTCVSGGVGNWNVAMYLWL